MHLSGSISSCRLMHEQGAIVCGIDINHNAHVQLKKDVSERNGMAHWCIFKVVVFCQQRSSRDCNVGPPYPSIGWITVWFNLIVRYTEIHFASLGQFDPINSETDIAMKFGTELMFPSWWIVITLIIYLFYWHQVKMKTFHKICWPAGVMAMAQSLKLFQALNTC